MGNSIKRCAKCLTILEGKVVVDLGGREFCSKFCRNEWWAENRRDAEEVYYFLRDIE